MKKLLILSTLISSIAFAQTVTENKTATMNISATVIQPLEVEVTKHIDLKTIVKGTTVQETGIFKVTGEPGANYTATLKGLSPGNTVLLKHKNKKDQFSVYITYDLNEATQSIRAGGNDHTILAKTTVLPNQASGEYTGELTMSVRYDG